MEIADKPMLPFFLVVELESRILVPARRVWYVRAIHITGKALVEEENGQ